MWAEGGEEATIALAAAVFLVGFCELVLHCCCSGVKGKLSRSLS